MRFKVFTVNTAYELEKLLNTHVSAETGLGAPGGTYVREIFVTEHTNTHGLRYTVIFDTFAGGG